MQQHCPPPVHGVLAALDESTDVGESALQLLLNLMAHSADYLGHLQRVSLKDKIIHVIQDLLAYNHGTGVIRIQFQQSKAV